MASGAPLSFAAVAVTQKEQEKKEPLRTVQLEGQVLLKIAKHCRESDATAMVTGQLLGLDVGSTLEVTDCFPYPVRPAGRRVVAAPPRLLQLACRSCVACCLHHAAAHISVETRVCRAMRARRSTRQWARARVTSWR